MPNFNMNSFPMLPIQGMAGGQMTYDAGGLAFLQGELEKQDSKLNEPLSAVTWQRDIPVKTGGGFVDSISSYNVSYGTTGANTDGILSTDSNMLPVIQADIDKDTYRVFVWGHIIKVPMIDQERMQKIGRPLDDLFNKGLRLAHDKELDKNVYLGHTELGAFGLVNSPRVATIAAAKTWATATPDEILDDINKVLTQTIQNSEYDNRGMANHILLPWQQYTWLVTRKVGTDVDKSIMDYLMENNIASKQGIDLTIEPLRYCEKAGTGDTDRLVAYRNDEDMVRMDITVPLKRLFTQASAEHIAYLTPYVCQHSEVQWHYLTHALYMDGI